MASSTQDLIPHLQLANTFGALFIGVIIAAVLFGVTIVQVFIYFQTHSGTGITFYKLVVILVWILDALHLALIIHYVYFYLVINYANISALTEIVWSCKLQPVVVVLSIFMDHVLYIHRIWTVSKGRSKVLAIIVGVAVVLASGLAIAIIWCMYQKIHVMADLDTIMWSVYMLYMYLGTVAFIDIFIASSLCYILATSRTGFLRQVAVHTLSIHNKAHDLYHQYRLFDEYVFNGSCYYMMPKNFIYQAVEFILLKLYVNSYIALLNVQYYAQPHTDTIRSSEYHIRHDVYRPRLQVGVSQDEELQASQKSIFKHPDDEVLHITRTVQTPQRPIEVAMQMNSLSST
ncbi:hypothetical protein DFJ58DRAFT_725596 [Suillus subalutaceus]|uniref:uncharacterized protein n=1 Tax=Suillus subalutaceus TaxID=48586 RepID=UPI001B87BA33|nr:uncharacterized protein DFJ58DRAFT_725596 [Suillus subalutaceus]KAG1861753.1 hypothetical protein DFJ58DRAFT_725596 [Suillus subalutaceus]